MDRPQLEDVIANPIPLLDRFEIIEDPRVDRHKKYPLKNVLFFAFVAILSDQQSWYQIVDFSEGNLDWFSEFIDVSEGAPSHDTFRRVFGLLEPQVLAAVLRDWAEGLRSQCGSKNRIVAIDGKSVRGVPWKRSDEELHILNAFEPGAALCLGQVEVDCKSNEITAMPLLLEALHLKGTIVTTDALLTQKSIAEHIRAKSAHYFLALKGNHPSFLEEAKLYFSTVHQGQFAWKTLEKNRGYVEERTCWVSGATWGWETLSEWPDLSRVIRIQSIRSRDGKTSSEERYYITSWESGALNYLDAARGHWGVENQLHRNLDVLFLEDASKEHDRTIAANLSVMRKIALGMLAQALPKKSLVSKRKRAAYDSGFRKDLILGKI